MLVNNILNWGISWRLEDENIEGSAGSILGGKEYGLTLTLKNISLSMATVVGCLELRATFIDGFSGSCWRGGVENNNAWELYEK